MYLLSEFSIGPCVEHVLVVLTMDDTIDCLIMCAGGYPWGFNCIIGAINLGCNSNQDWTRGYQAEPRTYSQWYLHALPLCHWGHSILGKLVLYMSPVAYLGKVFTPKGYRKCYICPGPVFWRKFNGDVCLVIRLTKYGNCSKYWSVYMFLAPFFDRNSTVIVIM